MEETLNYEWLWTELKKHVGCMEEELNGLAISDIEDGCREDAGVKYIQCSSLDHIIEIMEDLENEDMSNRSV